MSGGTKVRQLERVLLESKQPKEETVKETKEVVEKPVEKKKAVTTESLLNRFNGTGKGMGRPMNKISINDLVKRGHILEREMKHKEAQSGIGHRPTELHIEAGLGCVNSTRLIRDNTLTVRRHKGTRPLMTSRPVSAELKEAILTFLETGDISTDLNDFDRGILYSFIATIDHYGNVSPEDFYCQRLLGLIARGELAPVNASMISEFNELLTIARKKKLLSVETLTFLEQKAKSVFRNRE